MLHCITQVLPLWFRTGGEIDFIKHSSYSVRKKEINICIFHNKSTLASIKKAINNYSFCLEAVDAIFMQNFRSQITLELKLDICGLGQV